MVSRNHSAHVFLVTLHGTIIYFTCLALDCLSPVTVDFRSLVNLVVSIGRRHFNNQSEAARLREVWKTYMWPITIPEVTFPKSRVKFLLTMMGIFEKIEILKKELQRSELCTVGLHTKVEGIIISLEETRDSKFETIWEKAEKESQGLKLEEPKFPCHRTLSRRIGLNPDSAHEFNTPQEYYSKIFYKVYDCVLSLVKERFDASTLSHLDEFENFLIGKEVDMTRIKEFYRDDFNEENLTKDRQIFLDITKRKKVKLNSTKDVVTFLKGNKWCAELVREYLKLIQLSLTVPGLTCINDRSFSSFRRITYVQQCYRIAWTILQDFTSIMRWPTNLFWSHWWMDSSKKIQNELIHLQQNKKTNYRRW